MKSIAAGRTSLADRLRRAFRAAPPVQLAVLFGSAASDRMHAASDVDIAVFAPGWTPREFSDGHLLRSLSTVARTDVDLVDLARASTLLKWQVATTGLPIIETTAGAFARFRAAAAAEYIDFAPALAHHGERFRRRLIELGRRR